MWPDVAYCIRQLKQIKQILRVVINNVYPQTDPIKLRQYKLICPALKGNQKFGVVWSYQEVRRLAALTTKEIYSILKCPGCNSLLLRPDTSSLRVHCRNILKTKRQWKSPGLGSDPCGNTGCSNLELQLLRKCPTVTLSQHDKTSYKNLAKQLGELKQSPTKPKGKTCSLCVTPNQQQRTSAVPDWESHTAQNKEIQKT
uniref:Uncharacterized protein n=1 Tax=Salmo trutta TaxID=8032 RepID=A0A674ACI1_SALTR